MSVKPYRRIDRPFSEIVKEIKELEAKFEVMEMKEGKQRVVLCNKWLMFQLLREIRYKVSYEDN